MTMDAYSYEKEIREALTVDQIESLKNYMDEDLKKLEALKPLIELRREHISRFIVHKYRIELFYHNSKYGGSFYRPSYKNPKSGEIMRDYQAGDKKGACYSVRVDHRVYEGGKIIKDEYDQYKSLSFRPGDKALCMEYFEGLQKLYGLKVLPREEMIKINPEIVSPALIMGSLWEVLP